MREFFKAFLLSLFFVSGIICPGLCGVGAVDNRFYVDGSLWATEPYKNFVRLETIMINFDSNGMISAERKSDCSAQYISKNLILSAGHCVSNTNLYDAVAFVVINYKGDRIMVSLLESKYAGTDNGDDWAIFLVDDSQYYSDSFFDVKVPSANTNVINAGWGAVRILSNAELEKIRQLSQEIKNLHSDEFYDALVQKMRENGMRPLKEDPKTLKASKCKIIFDDSRNARRSKYFPDILVTTCDTWSGNSGGGYVSLDGNYLYGVASFNYTGYASFDENIYSNYMASTRQFADAVTRLKQQYSGGGVKSVSSEAYESMEVNTLSAGSRQPALKGDESQNILSNLTLDTPRTPQGYVDVQTKSANNRPALKGDESQNILSNLTLDTPRTPQGYVDVQTKSANNRPALKGDESQNILSNLSLNSMLPKKQTEKEITDLETKVQNQEKEINRTIPNVPKLSNSETLAFVNILVEHDIDKDRLEELKKSYEKAKSNEQSKANRLLTAATVATTGIGGMELAQGLAEQKADKNAERSMDAYIATMRCKYGDSQVKAGTTEIELPGGNDSTLMKYRTEYFSLAADLKERKSALGLKPGIESEEILDKSQMGLYGNENIGITDGAYSSLYRAKMLDSEKDKQEIEAAKETSQKRVTGGGTAAGVGVVGGIVGDRLINGK